MTGRASAPAVREEYRAQMVAVALEVPRGPWADSVCSCGKRVEHLDADPNTAEWACRVPSA